MNSFIDQVRTEIGEGANITAINEGWNKMYGVGRELQDFTIQIGSFNSYEFHAMGMENQFL